MLQYNLVQGQGLLQEVSLLYFSYNIKAKLQEWFFVIDWLVNAPCGGILF
jgi:hypothetical protein